MTYWYAHSGLLAYLSVFSLFPILHPSIVVPASSLTTGFQHHIFLLYPQVLFKVS